MHRSADAAGERPLPAGVVTFLLTDVDGSTRLWREASDAARLMARQAELIASAIARHCGLRPLEQGEGDSTLAVFERPSQALAAALDAQLALAAEPWPNASPVRVRMAVHTGEAVLRDAHNYGGTAIIRCARLRGLAHGGQVVVSSATAAVASEGLVDGIALRPLESVSLKGFDGIERPYQLCHPDLPSDFPSLRQPRALPAWPTALVGRAREREDVAALLETSRLVTITGAGGSGKTRLAHAVAEQGAERWDDGVVWVELARLTTGAQVASAVADACGAPDTGPAPPIAALARFLSASELLLVLDNCEHLIGDCAQLVDAVLRAGAGVRILATSREPLGVEGETTWRIPSMSLPPAGEHDPERLLGADAVRLFVERATAVRADFRLTAENAPALLRVCQRLDGIPLALELAAARVRALSLERLADGLDDRFRLLTGGARTAMARQRTLLASVEWSHDLLDDNERLLFRRLAVFAAPFSLEAAEAVAADDALDQFAVLDVLTRLLDKSLIVHAGDRYRMLETLRQYALGRAHDAGELAALRERHLVWMRRRAATWRLDREVLTEDVLAQVTAEAPDLLSALDWSQRPGRALAIELLFPLAGVLEARHAHEELRALAARVLAGLEEGSPAWMQVLAPMAIALVFATEIGWMPAARAALDAPREAFAPEVRSAIEHALSIGLAFGGLPEGFAGLRRALDDARLAGNRTLEVGAVGQLAILLMQIGDRGGARPYLAWLDRHVPPNARVGFLLEVSQGLAATYDGDFAAGLRLVRARLEEGRDPAPVVLAGLIAFWTEDMALAKRAVDLVDRLPDNGMFDVFICLTRTTSCKLSGDLDGARRHLERGRLFGGPVNGHLISTYHLAQIELGAGNLDAAEALAAEIEAQTPGTALYVITAQTGLLRAALQRERGEAGAAEAAAHAALAIAWSNELSLVITEALEMLAVLAADVGDTAGAARQFGAAEAFRDRTGFRWREPYQRRALDALRESLAACHLAEGARLSLAEAVEYARRGRGERGRPAQGWDSLTPSERRVVELVAAGLPNKDIAAKLFVSVATVKTHLIHVYAKLEVRTRSELAAGATRRGLGAT
jgi:predicted ATPase/DNA-binding CsgD family transcriptional regulator